MIYSDVLTVTFLPPHCRELKDNLGSDDPEGDVPVLLQTVLSRNPNIFREKSKSVWHGVQGGTESVSWTLLWSTLYGLTQPGLCPFFLGP